MAPKLPIYLDHAATTRCDPRVVEAMLPSLTETFGNPGSRNPSFGWAAEDLVDNARRQVADLIGALGNERLFLFYAWQHGMGCMKKLPKAQELLQMPGRGRLDFKPLLVALAQVKYRGWTEIFMHPVPRGIPILDSTEKVTAEIVRSRAYLEKSLM